MRNWSVDTKFLSKFPEKYAIWRLEQLINFGLNGSRLGKTNLKKYLPKLNIDSQKKKYLEFILDG